MKENDFVLKKNQSRQYYAETLTNIYNADDLALLENTLTQAVSQLHSLEQASGNIGFYVDGNKTEFMTFK